MVMKIWGWHWMGAEHSIFCIFAIFPAHAPVIGPLQAVAICLHTD